MSSVSLILLEKLINEHPNSYVKIGEDTFIPVRKELFDLEYVRVSTNSNGFTKSKHLDLPILFSCDENEKSLFEYLHKKLVYGKDNDLSLDKIEVMKFIISLSRIANTKEIKSLIQDITIHDDIWLNIWKYNIDLISLFTREQRMHACSINYYHYIKSELDDEEDICEYSNPTKKMCRYGDGCKFNKNNKCIFRHIIENKTSNSGLIDSEEMNSIHNIFDSYGFVYFSSRKEFIKLTTKPNYRHDDDYELDRDYKWKLYRTSTQTIYDFPTTEYKYRTKYKFVVLDKESEKYDLQNELKTKIPITCSSVQYKKAYKKCEYNIIIDGKVELFYLIRVWEQYNCGYRCEDRMYHRHGN